VSVRPSEVISDPVGVIVELVGALEPSLCSDVVKELVKTLAKSRATRRRLAQAISDRPGLLLDGRSPAPRVAGELLIAFAGLGRSTSRRRAVPAVASICDFPGSRSALVLRGMRNKAHHVRFLRQASPAPFENRSGSRSVGPVHPSAPTRCRPSSRS